jgi:hypothetical protein
MEASASGVTTIPRALVLFIHLMAVLKIMRWYCRNQNRRSTPRCGFQSRAFTSPGRPSSRNFNQISTGISASSSFFVALAVRSTGATAVAPLAVGHESAPHPWGIPRYQRQHIFRRCVLQSRSRGPFTLPEGWRSLDSFFVVREPFDWWVVDLEQRAQASRQTNANSPSNPHRNLDQDL